MATATLAVGAPSCAPTEAAPVRSGRRAGTRPRHDELTLRRYAATRDPRLRDELVARYLPLARYAAGRYARGSEPFDDLLQVASIGLLKAIDRYDPARASAFSSYAMPTMTGELRRYFRDRIWAVRPPRDLQEQALRVEAVIERLTGERGRAPTVAEIAADAALDEEVVLEALEAGRARTGVSLETAAGPDGDGDVQLESLLGRPEAGFAAAEDRATLAALSRTLTRRERLILSLRFDEDLTQAEIGARVGISQMHVSRIVRGAIDRLRIAAEAAQAGG